MFRIVWMVLCLAIAVLYWRSAHAQEISPWAYTLPDQNEDEYVTLRTQYGTLRVLLDGGCQYIAANQNILIFEWHETHAKVIADSTDGMWQPICTLIFTAQMDEYPCMMNQFGDCDIWVENQGGLEEVVDASRD